MVTLFHAINILSIHFAMWSLQKKPPGELLSNTTGGFSFYYEEINPILSLPKYHSSLIILGNYDIFSSLTPLLSGHEPLRYMSELLHLE